MGPFERVFLYFARRKLVVPVGIALVLLVSAAGIFQLRFDEDVFALLPQDEPIVAESRLVLKHYRGLERVVIALESDDPSALAAGVDRADRTLRELRGVKNVMSRIDRSAEEDIFLLYSGKAPLLFDAAFERQLTERLSRDWFQQRLREWLAAQSGLPAADTFRSDPFGLDQLAFRRFEHLSSGFAGRKDSLGRLLSPDGRFAVLFVEADFASADTGRGREFMAALDGALGRLEGVTPHVIGAHRSSVDNAEVLRFDMQLTMLTSVLGILVLFVIAFRSLTPIALPLLSVGFGFVFALGLQGWVRGSVSAITAGFAAVLLGVAVDYAIHLVSTYGNAEGDRMARAREAIRTTGRPSFVAMLTTVAAIFMLRFSRFDGLHQLSEMAIAGIAGALVFALIAGPQLLRVAGPARGTTPALGRVLTSIGRSRAKAPAAFLLASVGITLLLGWQAMNVQFDGDVTNLDGKSRATAASEALVAKAFGQDALRRTLVLSSGPDLESALRANDEAAIALDALRTSHEGISWVLPAIQTQQENFARWRRFWSDQRLEDVKSLMAAATAIRTESGEEYQPFKRDRVEDRFAVFFGMLRAGTAPAGLRAADLRTRPIWQLLGSFVTETEGRVYAATTAQADPSRLGEVKALAPNAMVLNKVAFAGRMISFIRRDLAVVGGLSLVLVIVILWLTFGRLREVLVALIPVGGAMIWTLGMMGLLEIPFNIINTLVAVFIAGLGIDYGIFFVQTWRLSANAAEAQDRLRHAGAGVLVAALTTLFGFGSLALARHPALYSVGVTAGIGVTSALLLTLFVVPTLLRAEGSHRIWKDV